MRPDLAMRRVIAAAAALGAVAACGSSTDAPAETRVYAHELPKPNYPRSQDTPESFIVPTTMRQRASRSKPRAHRQDAPPTATSPVTGDVWHALAVCESGMRQEATSPNGLYLSYFQWSLPTWRSVGGVGDPRTVPYETQVVLAKRLQARSGWGQWPRCSQRLGLA